MKNTLYLMLGILLVILTSSATVSVMTVIPKTPKCFIVQNFENELGSENAKIFIETKIKNGWILKSLEGANQGKYSSTWIVVMEKY